MTTAPPAKVCAVLWDVGGTLLDWSSHQKALHQALKNAGILPARISASVLLDAEKRYWKAETTWRTLAEEEQGLLEIAARMLEGTEYASEEQIQRLGHYLQRYEEFYFFIPGIRELLQELHASNIRQAIVSNWPPSLPRFLAFHKLTDFFPIIVGSGEEGVWKPDIALFQCALDRLNIPPQEAVYVGNDPASDILPARALGMQAIHFDPRRRYPGADTYEAAELRRQLFELLDLTEGKDM